MHIQLSCWLKSLYRQDEEDEEEEEGGNERKEGRGFPFTQFIFVLGIRVHAHELARARACCGDDKGKEARQKRAGCLIRFENHTF
jgi:hypothetical protein